MNIQKTCSCGTHLTTKNITSKGITSDLGTRILWFNCNACNSTLILKRKVQAAPKSCESRTNWMSAAVATLALVLFAHGAHAEQAVECKEAIRAFNKTHGPAQLGVWVHDNAADPVLRLPKGYKQPAAAQAAAMGAIRVCIKTKAMGGFVYMSPEDGPGGKVCEIINVESMAASCSPNEARVVFKAVK